MHTETPEEPDPETLKAMAERFASTLPDHRGLSVSCRCSLKQGLADAFRQDVQAHLQGHGAEILQLQRRQTA